MNNRIALKIRKKILFPKKFDQFGWKKTTLVKAWQKEIRLKNIPWQDRTDPDGTGL